jgi:hypothetical protein
MLCERLSERDGSNKYVQKSQCHGLAGRRAETLSSSELLATIVEHLRLGGWEKRLCCRLFVPLCLTRSLIPGLHVIQSGKIDPARLSSASSDLAWLQKTGEMDE